MLGLGLWKGQIIQTERHGHGRLHPLLLLDAAVYSLLKKTCNDFVSAACILMKRLLIKDFWSLNFG